MGPATAASAAGTLYASPTGTGGVCSSGNPCSITTAVATAAPGSTIILANGTYNAQLSISTNGLLIKGATVADESSVIIQPVGPLANNEVRANPPTNSPMQAIIGVQPGVTGVKLLNMTVDGSQAAFDGNNCALKPAGIVYKNAKGVIQHVHVMNIQPTGNVLTGCQWGEGVYVGTDPAVNATTSNVKFVSDTIDTYNKNGITCNLPGTFCNLVTTTVVGSGPTAVIGQNGVQFGFGGGGAIHTTKVSQNQYTPDGEGAGILLYDAADNVVVLGSNSTLNDTNINAINDGAGAGQETKNLTIKTTKATHSTFYDGIALDSVDGAILTSNTLNANMEYGLGIYGATNGSISKNIASFNSGGPNPAGIYVAGPGSASASATGNNVFQNTAKSNSGPGIFADTGSSGNTFTSNIMKLNSPDAKDTTAPANNTWTTNNCTTSSPPTGLC